MSQRNVDRAVDYTFEHLGFCARDEGLLESALARPVTTVYGSPVYPSLAQAAAAQSESLAGLNFASPA